MQDGIILINKPQVKSSHDIVYIVKKRLAIGRDKKVGHAGTLDPMATGVLIILIGHYTRYFDKFLEFDKEYLATIQFGDKTDTGDCVGKIVDQKVYAHVTREQLEQVLIKYTGDLLQVPPMYSAAKKGGKPLYKFAVKGRHVEREAKKIKILDLKLLEFTPPQIKLYIKCSKGTYIRQLAEDIAQDLNTFAHVSELTRQSVGPFHINQCINLDQIGVDKIQTFNF